MRLNNRLEKEVDYVHKAGTATFTDITPRLRVYVSHYLTARRGYLWLAYLLPCFYADHRLDDALNRHHRRTYLFRDDLHVDVRDESR
jgi:hypothetical protein